MQFYLNLLGVDKMIDVFMNNKKTNDEEWEVLFWLSEHVGSQYITRSLTSNDYDRTYFLEKTNNDWLCFFNNWGWVFVFKDRDKAMIFKLTWC